jgi:hypothetical protein
MVRLSEGGVASRGRVHENAAPRIYEFYHLSRINILPRGEN